jgi:putative transposase
MHLRPVSTRRRPNRSTHFHDKSVRVTRCGRICLGRRKVNPSGAFAGEIVGIREVDEQIWLVSFLDFDLGLFDQDEGRVEPAPNPFVPETVLTMSPE